ncbi:ABC transporter ATP-binding protein [Trueperella pyogenes]|nr:ABC transporter ATP-binding protein [Trueperella pyogenes]AZR02893.1 ABC transporter ATP-binding protein [Trueperella pyogenes]
MARIRSAVTGRFVTRRTAARWPDRTYVDNFGKNPSGSRRSAITGRFLKSDGDDTPTSVRHG